jgi:hypothetical protein
MAKRITPVIASPAAIGIPLGNWLQDRRAGDEEEDRRERHFGEPMEAGPVALRHLRDVVERVEPEQRAAGAAGDRDGAQRRIEVHSSPSFRPPSPGAAPR